MFEPQKETEPTIAAKTREDRDVGRARRRSRRVWRNSTHAMSATAPPPTPLNSATICGIAVIFTLRAAGTPTTVPIDDAEDDQAPVADAVGSGSVATTAMAMPTAAMRLPRTAVVGPVSPRSP